MTGRLTEPGEGDRKGDRAVVPPILRPEVTRRRWTMAQVYVPDAGRPVRGNGDVVMMRDGETGKWQKGLFSRGRLTRRRYGWR